MGRLEETRLPGIGVRLEFFTEEGRRMGVVRHNAGRREVFVCEPHDPDMTQVAVHLSEDDARSLAQALGVPTVTESGEERPYEVEGLVFDWLDVSAGSPLVGRTIGEEHIRTRTGASVVAVLRHPASIPAPDPDLRLEAGDTLVVAGTSEGVAAVRELIRTG